MASNKPDRSRAAVNEIMKKTEREVSLGSWKMDPETGQIICSPEVFEILDCPSGKSLTKNELVALIHPKERDKILASLEKAMEEEGSFDFEARLNNKEDDTQRRIRLRGSTLAGSGNESYRLTGIIQDITALKEDVKFSNALIETTTDGYLMISLATDAILDVNPAYCQMTGYSREEVLEMRIGDLDVNYNLEAFKNQVEQIVERRAGRFETRHRRKDGDIINVEISLTIIRKGTTDIVVAFVRDITEQKEAQRRLKQNEKRWHRLVENNPQPVQIVRNGKITFINQAGAELYGATKPEELIGRTITDFSHHETLEKVENRKQKLENEQYVEPSEHKIKKLDGSVRFVEAHSIPITFEGETAIQTVLYDLTERERQEKKVRSSLQEKEMLLKEIHHRVKNNLSVISGLLELQALNAEDPSTLDTLRDSQQRIHSMAMIHEKLYQSEALSDIGFDLYLKDLVNSISRTYNTDKRSIDISYDLEAVALDLDQAIPCSLIVNEIVVNCYKHAFGTTGEGEITITSVAEDDELIIRIKDNGKSLPDDFDINEQQSLGMTLVQTLTRQLEGAIDFSSNEDAGTTFELRFERD